MSVGSYNTFAPLLDIKNIYYQETLEILKTIGMPYHWGKNDCSGYAQFLLNKYQGYDLKIDRTAYILAMISDERQWDYFGFLAFYGKPVSHVMYCLGGGWVIGACNGDSKTFSNKINAYVKLQRLHYRRLACIGELKDEYKNENV